MNDIQSLGFTNKQVEEKDNSLVESNSAKAVAEVQAAYVIAKKFPRDQHAAYVNIIESCKRPFLAEQSMYAYPKGGSMVNGPSIRLAEVLCQNWGNVDVGIREVSQSNGVSVAEAYAIDLQTNTRVTKIFHVKHERSTKRGNVKLTDPRDIYELIANNGSRRLRACILAIIPGDVIEAAVAQCKKTLESSDVPLADQVRKMILAFDELGVKVEHLEKRLGHNLDSVIPEEIVILKSIYKSLKDGMAKREDFFEIGQQKIESIDTILESKLTEKSTPIILTSQPPKLKFGFDYIKKEMEKAKSLDELDLALSLASELDSEKAKELTEIYLILKEKLNVSI